VILEKFGPKVNAVICNEATTNRRLWAKFEVSGSKFKKILFTPNK